MPSDNEIKQIMTEKVFPFFDGGGLDQLLARIENLEKGEEITNEDVRYIVKQEIEKIMDAKKPDIKAKMSIDKKTGMAKTTVIRKSKEK